MTCAYYNEIDPYAAQWLRNLIAAGHIAAGEVDERSIVDVQPDDLAGFTQCHFFAGIGGWSYALRLAGWPDDRSVWSGSCPCQPFSEAGHGRGFDDPRHLWPQFYRLIRERRPSIVFGEQTPKAKLWFDAVCSDMEAVDYAIAAAVLPAGAVGAPHKRERIVFVAHANGEHEHRSGSPGASRRDELANGRGWETEPDVGRVAHGIPGRVGQLRGFGNAIVPQVAAEFIGAYMDTHPTPNPGDRHVG